MRNAECGIAVRTISPRQLPALKLCRFGNISVSRCAPTLRLSVYGLVSSVLQAIDERSETFLGALENGRSAEVPERNIAHDIHGEARTAGRPNPAD